MLAGGAEHHPQIADAVILEQEVLLEIDGRTGDAE